MKSTGLIKRLLRLLFLILISAISVKTAWGMTPKDDFYRPSYIHSYANLYYRFFQSQPSLYEIGVEGRIPYGYEGYRRYEGRDGETDSANPNDLIDYRLETTLGYTAIFRGVNRHHYSLQQSWYGDFFHVVAGYGYTHRVDPLASYQHELPFSLGGFISDWEFKLFGSLGWRPSDFFPLFGGSIAYLFTTRPRSAIGYFERDPVPHRVDISVYQTSTTSFGVRNTYQFSLLESTSPHLRLLFSWEIFPIRVGMAFKFAWRDKVQATSHTRYSPQWGFDHSLEVGLINYRHSVYGNQVKGTTPTPTVLGNDEVDTNNSESDEK